MCYFTTACKVLNVYTRHSTWHHVDTPHDSKMGDTLSATPFNDVWMPGRINTALIALISVYCNSAPRIEFAPLCPTVAFGRPSGILHSLFPCIPLVFHWWSQVWSTSTQASEVLIHHARAWTSQCFPAPYSVYPLLGASLLVTSMLTVLAVMVTATAELSTDELWGQLNTVARDQVFPIAVETALFSE